MWRYSKISAWKPKRGFLPGTKLADQIQIDLGFPSLQNCKVKNFWCLCQQSPTILAPGTSLVKDNFSMHWGGGGRWFQDDSSTLYLLCTLFLVMLHQLHLRLSGIRSQSLGSPGLSHPTYGIFAIVAWDNRLCFLIYLYIYLSINLSYL